MQLRHYQLSAINSLAEFVRSKPDRNPCVVIPTAGGKTPVIATLCSQMNECGCRVLVVAHVKELIEQTFEKIRVIDPQLPVGIYSAGLRQKELDYAVTLASIQSIYRVEDLPHIDYIIIDEAHLIPPDGDGMYQTIIERYREKNQRVQVIGLTATPYRMKSGMICSESGPLHEICYQIGIKELIRDGYLSRLICKGGIVKADLSEVHVRGGEFIATELAEACDKNDIIMYACREIDVLTKDRKSTLVFCTSIDHAYHVRDELRQYGVSETVESNTPADERRSILERFKLGEIKFLTNVEVLTTGFDAPNIDCIVMLRPTMSAGLYYQMVGRGFRISPGKTNCLILDFADNIIRHGPVDAISPSGARERSHGGPAPAKECQQCQSIVACGYTACPDCGSPFPKTDARTHNLTATDAEILSGESQPTSHDVLDIRYSKHIKQNATPTDKPTLRVDYKISPFEWKSEWVCIEHSGYAKEKARAWWKKRSELPFPNDVDEAVDAGERRELNEPKKITTLKPTGEKYERIIKHEFEEPPPVPTWSEEDLPF